MENCKIGYSPEYFNQVMIKRLMLDDASFMQYLINTFNTQTAEAIVDAIANGRFTPDITFSENQEKDKIEIVESISTPGTTRTSFYTPKQFHTFFEGGLEGAQYKQAYDQFQRELVMRLVWNSKTGKSVPDPNRLNTFGISIVTQEIFNYMRELISKILPTLSINIDMNFPDTDSGKWSEVLGLVTSAFNDAMVKNRIFLDSDISENENYKEAYKSYAILSSIDELLDRTGLVSIRPEYAGKNVFASDKYIWTGNGVSYIERYGVEDADISDYTSPIVTTILDTINWNKESNTGKIGLGGFTDVMGKFVKWLRTQRSEEIRKEFEKGLDADWSSLINKYKTAMGKKLSSLEKNIINAIQSEIFDSNMHKDLKDLFSAQVLNTCQSTYLEIKGTPGKRATLATTESHIYDKTAQSIKNRLATTISYIASDPALVKAYQDITRVSVKEALDSPGKYIVSIVLPSAKAVNIVVNTNILGNKANSLYSDQEAASAIFIAGDENLTGQQIKELNSIVALWTGLNIPETIIKDFPFYRMLALSAVLSTFDENRLKKFINFNTTRGSYNFVQGGFNSNVIAADINTLSDVLGTSVVKTIRDLNDNILPSAQLNSWYTTVDHVISQAIDSPNHALHDNLFCLDENAGAYMGCGIRKDIKMGTKSKTMKDLIPSEALTWSIIYDFLVPLTKGETGEVWLQPMVFSDKVRQFLDHVDLKKIKIKVGEKGKVRLYDIISAIINKSTIGSRNPITVIKEAIKEQRKISAYRSASHLIAEAIKVFGASSIGYNERFGLNPGEIFNWAITHQEDFDKVWDNINNAFRGKSGKEIAELYKNSGAILHGAIRAAANEKPEDQIDLVMTVNGDYILNPLLKHNIDLFRSDDAEEYFKSLEFQFAQELQDVGFSLSADVVPIISSIGGSTKISTDKGLNPLLQAYLYTHLLVGHQLQEIHQGCSWNYRTKYKFDPVNPNYSADISHRFIDESKRAMGAGATIKKINPRKWGVGSIWRMAAVYDLTAPVNGLTAIEKEELVADGYVCVSPEQAILENRSLPDGKVGDNFKKLIFSQMDESGSMNQIKTAAFTVSNELRTRNPHSVEMNMEKLYRMTHSDSIELGSWIEDYYNINGEKIEDENHTLTHTKTVFYYDPENNQYFKILRVGVGSNGLFRIIQEVDSRGNNLGEAIIQDRQPLVNGTYSMYDLDQLFGGAWCMEQNSTTGKLEASNANNIILANIMCGRPSLKNKIIHYVVPVSSFKVGMKNINSVDSFNLYTPDTKLWEFTFDPYNVGVQLNAGHYVEGGHVSEPTQLMQALGQEGVLIDLVNAVYNELGTITRSIRDKFSKTDLMQAIAEELIYSINHSGKTKSITDVFLLGLQNKIEQKLQVKLPLSSPGISSKFESVILTALNKSIQHKFPGLGTVQAPSYGYMQHFGDGLSYTELLQRLKKHGGYTIKQMMEGVWDGKYLNGKYVSDMLSTDDETISGSIPVMSAISANEINFEDTIVYHDGVGFKVVKIDGIKKYDEFRNLRTDESTQIFRWNTQGRDLLQQIVYFKTAEQENNGHYTLYDFDSNRATFYISEVLKAAKQKDPAKRKIDFWDQKKAIILSTLLKDHVNDISALRAVLDDPFNNIEALKLYAEEAKRQFKEDCRNYSDKAKAGELFELNISAAGGQVSLLTPTVKHAQVILGKMYAKKLGLESGDNVRTILEEGASFFEKRLTGKMFKPTTLNGMVDATLHSENGNVYVVVGDNAAWAKMAHTSRVFNNINGSIYYKGNKINGAEGIEFGTFTDTEGQTHDFIKVNNIRQLKALQNSEEFNLLEYNYTQKNVRALISRLGIHLDEKALSKENIENTVNSLREAEREKRARFIKRLAEDKYEAFKTSLTMIGARIPTQALQSVSAIDVIGFTNSTENEIYLPRTLTWIAGSDYDIDKFYVMGWNILEDGRLPHKGNLYGYSANEVDTLPNPTGSTFTWANEDDSNVIEVSVQDLKTYSIDALKKALNEHVVTGKTAIRFVGFSDVPETIEGSQNINLLEALLCEDFIDNLNKYNNPVNAKRIGRFSTAIAMNNTIKHIIAGFNDTAVQDALLSPLNTDRTDELADRNKEAKEEKNTFNPDLPTSIFKQQYNNMVGKASVGIVAQNNKTFNIIVYNINSRLNDLAKDYRAGKEGEDSIFKYLNSITFKKKLIKEDEEDKEASQTFAGLNLRPLIKALEDGGASKELIDRAKLLQANSDKTDPYDSYSNLMSAATDNAKLLELSPLNAIGNILNLYCYLVSTGESLEDIANLFTSSIFNVVNKFTKYSIFETDKSDYTALRDALTFLRDEGDLSIVSKSSLKAFYKARINYNFAHEKDFEDTLRKHLNGIKDSDGSEIAVFNGTQLNLSNDIIYNIALSTYKEFLREGTKWNESSGKVEETEWAQKEWEVLCKPRVESNQGYSSDMYGDDIDFEEEEGTGAVSSSNRSLISTSYYFEKYLRYKYALLSKYSKDELDKLRIAQKLLDGADEFTNLGYLLKINQGQAGDAYGRYSLIVKVENIVNNKIKGLEKPIKFDINLFFTDPDYAQKQINQYEKVKSDINILQYLYNSPHFREMYNSVVASNEIIDSNAVASALILKLAKKYTGFLPLTSKEYGVISKYVSDLITYHFVSNLPSEFSLYCGKDDFELVKLDKEGSFNFKARNATVFFKKFVERVLIPYLKKSTTYGNNKFVQALSLTTSNKNNIRQSNFSINVERGEFDQTAEQFESVKADFLNLAPQKLEDRWLLPDGHEWTYGDIFYLYHLLISGERYGSVGLGAIFSELVTNKAYKSPLVNMFHEAIGNMDSIYQTTEDKTDLIETLLPYNSNDLEEWLDIARGEKFPAGIYLDTDKVFKFSGKYNEANPEPYRAIKSDSSPKADRELPFELYKIFGSLFGSDRIQLTTDEQLDLDRKTLFRTLSDEEFNSLKTNANGFIHNGVIYLNQDKFTGSTMFHEFAHIIAAHVKFSDNPWYYSTADMLWNSTDSEISKIRDDIENRYPNRSIMDKKEELFAEYIAHSIINNLEKTGNYTKERIETAVREIFRIDPSNINFDRLAISKIEDILKVFKSALFSTSGTSFDATKVILSQELVSIKNRLLHEVIKDADGNSIKVKDESGNEKDKTMLIEDCK